MASLAAGVRQEGRGQAGPIEGHLVREHTLTENYKACGCWWEGRLPCSFEIIFNSQLNSQFATKSDSPSEFRYFHQVQRLPMIRQPNAQQRPTKAQRAAQSARDKAANRASGMPQRVSNGAPPRAPPRRQRNRGGRLPRAQGSGGVPPIAGFFAPVAEGTIMKSVKPVFFRNNFNTQRIIHREKVAKLTTPGTGTFTVLGTFPLNPGLSTFAPWIANEAQGWEYYRFNRVRYIWVPTSGTAVAGNIIMAPDYDASDAAPVGETFMSAYTDCEEANVWARFAAELTPDLLNAQDRRKLVRLGALSANQDIKLYDSGNFFVVSADDAVANSGKLWVEYDVEFYDPQTPPGGFQGVGTLYNVNSLGTLSTTNPWGISAAPQATGPITLSAAAAVMTIGGVQVGQEISVSSEINGSVITVVDYTTLTGMTAKTADAPSCINAGQTASVIFASYLVTAPNPTITLAITATTVTANYTVVAVLAPQPTF